MSEVHVPLYIIGNTASTALSCGCCTATLIMSAALEATQGQNDSFLSQLPYKCYLEEVASVGD